MLPEVRRALVSLLKIKPLVRIMEAHNGLTGLIVENASVVRKTGSNGSTVYGFRVCAIPPRKAKTDIELVDLTSWMNTISTSWK